MVVLRDKASSPSFRERESRLYARVSFTFCLRPTGGPIKMPRIVYHPAPRLHPHRLVISAVRLPPAPSLPRRRSRVGTCKIRNPLRYCVSYNATNAIFVAAPLMKTAWIIPSANATLWKIGGNIAWSTSSINAVNVMPARYANSLCTLLKSTSEFYQFSLAYGPHNGRKSLSVINEVNNVAYRHGRRRRGPFNGSLVPGDINEIQRVCSSASPRFPDCIIDHELNSRTRKTVIKSLPKILSRKKW